MRAALPVSLFLFVWTHRRMTTSVALPTLDSFQLATPRVKDTYGRTIMPPKREQGDGPLQPLHLAASAGDLEKLKEILHESPAGLEGLAKFGWSPLILAARSGNADAVHVLTKAGASVRVQDQAGSTALHRAAFHGSVKVRTRQASQSAMSIQLTP